MCVQTYNDGKSKVALECSLILWYSMFNVLLVLLFIFGSLLAPQMRPGLVPFSLHTIGHLQNGHGIFECSIVIDQMGSQTDFIARLMSS